MNCQKYNVFVLTFIAYTLMHSGRTDWSYVTKPLWDLKIPYFQKNTTGYVNLTFQLSYAIALYLGEPLSSKIGLAPFIGWGAFLSGLFVFLIGGFGIIGILNALNGFFESSVLPGSIALMAQYYTKNTGVVFGLWCGCKNFGDVAGLYFGQFSMQDAGLTAYQVLVIQGLSSMFIGILCVIFLKEIQNSEFQQIQVTEPLYKAESLLSENQRLNWMVALKIKKLQLYVCIQSLLKSIVYGLLFWLPSYIQDQDNPQLHNESGIISSMNYYGSFIGGVLIGYLSDKLHKKSTIQFIFLILAAGVFILFSFLSDVAWPYYFDIFFIGVFMGGVFNNISGVLAVNLGKLPQFKNNKKAVKSLSSIIECISSFVCALFQGVIGEIPFKFLFPLFGIMTGLCLICLGFMIRDEWKKDDSNLESTIIHQFKLDETEQTKKN